MNNLKRNLVNLGIQTAFFASLITTFSSMAEEKKEKELKLEVIEVTARKQVENAQEIPLSVSALQGNNLDNYSAGGVDIRFMNAKLPSLAVESSFGRAFPRFYVRGLGNTDFDLNASQPVSLIVDDVVQENAILKGFPVFDTGRVELLRGPQGTLFGRNSPAGVVKFESVKPSDVFEGYASVSYGTHNTVDFQGAIAGGLTDNLSARVSLLNQTRDDYIDNLAPGFEVENQVGGYDETAARIQFLYEVDNFSALLNYHFRDMEGSPIIFRANIIKPGTNDLISTFDREKIYHDAAHNANQEIDNKGGSLKLVYNTVNYTFTSISGYESAGLYSRGDIDGGYGCGFCGIDNGPDGFVPFAAETADGIPDHEQLTQEFHITSNFNGDFNFQTGFFYFSEELSIDTFGHDSLGGGALNGYVTQEQDTTAWAVFTSFNYTVSDKLKVTGGVRYSNDEKDFTATRHITPFAPPGSTLGPIEVSPEDSHISWDISSVYEINSDVNWYTRIAEGFRSPSIQGRILFGDLVTVADSETVLSFETGIKSDFLNGRGRVNAAVYHYTIDNQQLTAVGGDANFAQLLNADKSVGYGFELDSEFLVTQDFLITGSVSYNNTEIQDKDLSVATCFACTVTDPINDNGFANINGNSLPNAPEWIGNITARYTHELENGEVYIHTDWSYRSEVKFGLYDSIEFTGKDLLEGGVRAGYIWYTGENVYEASLFVRNITDEEQHIGGLDFNNNAGMINEGRFVGVEFKVNFD